MQLKAELVLNVLLIAATTKPDLTKLSDVLKTAKSLKYIY